ncbi:MAG: DUF1674 domain-containing protein [Alphaproteobacteria bacterium]|nr:DUF1674 domain-containing protein [Alphaproteobacteria bacterium]
MSTQKQNQSVATVPEPEMAGNSKSSDSITSTAPPKEKGGRKGPEPTRYGDWELNGKCVDF